MDKTALLNIDPATVGRFATGGLLAGGGTAALVNLVHMVREMHQERAKRKRPNETDENTIVLTLPQKKAFVEASKGEPTKIKRVLGSTMSEHPVTAGKQLRHHTGEYGTKTAATGWPTLTAGTLAALGTSAAGAALVDKLYEKRRERQLQLELDKAKQEYMDVLGGHKTASWVEYMFDIAEPTKQASDSSFGFLNYPLAAAALLSILGTGGAGYLTKKILDAKLQDTADKGMEGTKVKRIVLQSAPTTDASKMASSEDINEITGTLLAMMDGISGRDQYLNTPSIKSAAAIAGTTTPQVAELSLEQPATFRKLMDANPQLWKAMVAQSRHSILGRMPGAKRLAANQMAAKVQGFMDQHKTAQAASAGGGSGAASGNNGFVRKLRGRTKQQLAPSWTKAAQDMTVPPAAGLSLINAVMGAKEPGAGEIAKEVVDQQAAAAHRATLAGIKEPGTIQVEAADPKAKQYLNRNQQKIVKVVKQLAAQGQI